MLKARRVNGPKRSGSTPSPVEVVLELLVAHVHRRRLVPDLVHHGEVLLVHAHLAERAQQGRRERVHRRGEVGREAEALRLQLVVHLAHLQHLRVVRSRRRVDLVAEVLVVLLGQGQEAAQQLLAVRADHDLLEAERVRGLQLPREEVVLLVGGHVAVLATPHVEVRAHRARLEPVLLERVEPELHERVVDVGVGAQQLGDVELDTRADALFGDGGDQRLGRVQPAANSLVIE